MPPVIIQLSEPENQQFMSFLEYAQSWCRNHQWQVGVGEIALGAGLIALGLENGAIEMGVDFIATVGDKLTADFLGGAAGTFVGALPGILVKSIGIVGMGTAIGVPAIALMGGGALILGLAGYGAGTLIQNFLHPLPSMVELAGAASLTLIGTALLVDGARRIAGDDVVKAAVTRFKDGALRLGEVHFEQAIASLAELREYLSSEVGGFLNDLATNPKTLARTAVLTAAGVGGGSIVATSSVTVLGSTSLGSVALSLGLVSAPVWPIIAGGGIALAAAYGIWRMSRPKAARPAHPVALGLPGMEPLRPAPGDGPESS